ncbi:hypothetical protein Agub_g10057 [Astrephomene gubernaculifera]|uniref:malate dehydrogenase n=1 Tax=Astrephomene gubernaculifera TaxID=47775 RepID=A0AAD3DX14_9CHLO|nr:hypothetical protein Agub_g10057 [Astrephomene gubernaculifera]
MALSRSSCTAWSMDPLSVVNGPIVQRPRATAYNVSPHFFGAACSDTFIIFFLTQAKSVAMAKPQIFPLAGAAILGAGLALGSKYLMKLRRKKVMRVLITGAAGQIGYALAPQVATGAMLGPDQPVILHLLDVEPAKNALEGLRMELVDGAYPLLEGVLTFTDVAAACKDVDVAVMVGGYPRKAGEERKDVMSKNVSIYKSQASALASNASKDVKVVVVANPANTNALILAENAPSIPRDNITCLTRLDHNRALGSSPSALGRTCPP